MPTAAMLDRILHRATVVAIQGDGCRFEDERHAGIPSMPDARPLEPAEWEQPRPRARQASAGVDGGMPGSIGAAASLIGPWNASSRAQRSKARARAPQPRGWATRAMTTPGPGSMHATRCQ